MGRKPYKPQLDIYIYDDFKPYLRDLIAELKQLDKSFTMRSFASAVGFGSPSYLKMIIDGERKLTDKTLPRLCEGLKIKGRARDYFENLVHFTQCEDPDLKKQYLQKLTELRPRVTFTKIKRSKKKYLSNDAYACIREMVLLKDFKEDAKWIAARCYPRIKPNAVREAIETLLDLELIKRNDQNQLVQSDPVIDTETNVQSIEAFRFHEAVLNKARHYLSHLEQKQRHFSALTIPIPKELESVIADKIHQVQNEILEMINAAGTTYDEVFQLNFQFFPVTTQTPAKKEDDV